MAILADVDRNERDTALTTLAMQFWAPIYGALRRFGHAPMQAYGTAGAFLCTARRWRLDGSIRFRASVMEALSRYLELDDRADVPLRVDPETAERLAALNLAGDESADVTFRRLWGQTVLARAFNVAAPGDPLRRAAIAAILNGIDSDFLRPSVDRLRRELAASLRGGVRSTVADESDVHPEIELLFANVATGGCPRCGRVTAPGAIDPAYDGFCAWCLATALLLG